MSNASPAQRGADWIVSLMQPDGSLRGASSINDYYKTAYGLAVAGRGNESERMLDYLARRFLKEDGDLDGTGCEWFELFRIYPHAWVLMTAVLRARFDIVHRVASFLERFQDPESGGFYTTPAQRDARGEQDLMTTGVCAIALLTAGRTDVAGLAGQWMQSLWTAQPDVKRGLYFVWHGERGRLVTDFPESAARGYFVDAQKTTQRYYSYGIPAALLSSIAMSTGQTGLLPLAREYLAASTHCQNDVYRQPQAGKVGWGACWTYRATRDPDFARLARNVARNLESLQNRDGWWSSLNVYQLESSDTLPKPSLDVTGELVGHLAWIESTTVDA